MSGHIFKSYRKLVDTLLKVGKQNHVFRTVLHRRPKGEARGRRGVRPYVARGPDTPLVRQSTSRHRDEEGYTKMVTESGEVARLRLIRKS